MLILRRRVGESILIGDSIEIQITEIGPSKVKIGVCAPTHIAIQRKELLAVKEQNRRAAAISEASRNALAKNISQLFTRTVPPASDKHFEARYFRHPETRENLEPA